MINKILEKTKGKPCSCPSGKICTPCKKKKVIPPQVIVEEPHRLPAPISIKYYKPRKSPYENNPHVQYVEKPKRWKLRKKTKYEPQPSRCMNVCRWYKRRKALNQLKNDYKKEKERERQRIRDEYEREMFRELVYMEQSKQRAEYLSPKETKPLPAKKVKPSRPKKIKPLPRKKTTPVHIKERSANVKPKAQSKYATVKKYDFRDTLTNRFVNYCYRFCCQLYCCLTCVILVAFSVICLV